MKKGVLYTVGSIIILVISFIAFILPSSLGSGSEMNGTVYGEYNGRKISTKQGSDFTQAIANHYNSAKNNGTETQTGTIYYSAFYDTVTKYAYEDFVNASGYKVPEEAINRTIREFFTDENGKYDKKLARQVDSSTIAELKKQLSTDLIFQRFSDDVFGESKTLGKESIYGIKTSDAETAFLESLAAEKRGFDYITYSKSDYPDEEVTKFAVSNKDKFRKYDFSLIVCNDKAEAEKILNRITKEEITFEDAIPEYSTMYYSNTEGKLLNDLEYQIENMLKNKEDLNQLKEIATGSLSLPLESLNDEFIIFKKNAAPVDCDITNEENFKTIRQYVSTYESGLIEDYFSAKAVQFTTKALNSDFDTACEEFGLTKKSIEPFALNYGNVSVLGAFTAGDDLDGAYKNENFLKTAFSMKMEEISSPVVVGNNIVVLKFTKTETAQKDETSYLSLNAQLTGYDKSSANQSILKNPKLKDNFLNTFYQQMYDVE